MLPLLLLISQAAGQAAPLSFFSTFATMSGEVLFKQSEATMIFVQDPSILRLRATLLVLSGEAHLVAMAEGGNNQQVWESTKTGNDEIVIEATDPSFTDGAKLMRSFVFVVIGMAPQASQYSLTIKAEFATQTLAALPISMGQFMKASERLNIRSLSQFDGVISAFTKKQTMSGELAKQQATALMITVTNPAVKQLRATLKVTSGDCDLYAITYVNQVERMWSSINWGSDEIVIRADDMQLTDGQMLMRDFLFVVVGMSTTPTAYELTITAEYAYTSFIATPTALASMLPGQDSIQLVTAEPLSAFTARQTMTGEVEMLQADAVLISVEDPNTQLLRFKLTVLSGDSDLVVMTEVNAVQTIWQSLTLGSDQITISAKDPKLTDNKGLQRNFVVVVVGMSSAPSSYELVITANPSPTVYAAAQDSVAMKEWTDLYEAQSGAISAWWVLSVAVVGAVAGFWLRSGLKDTRKKTSSEYVLL